MTRLTHQRPKTGTSKRAQNGVALITALLVVAIATVAATSMMSTQNIAVHRSAGLLNVERSWWYATGLETWAGQILKRDKQNNSVDHCDEPWLEEVFLPIEGGSVSGRIVDLQGRFNLNNLVLGDAAEQQRSLEQFEEMLVHQDAANSFEARALAQALADWMDDDIQARFPDGAEDSYYGGLELPYRTPNSAIGSTQELRMVRGVDNDFMDALRDNDGCGGTDTSLVVTVLPVRTAINVNTASVAVLAALSPTFTKVDAEDVVSSRRGSPFNSVADFMSHKSVQGKDIVADDVTIESNYLMVEGAAQVGTAITSLYSLLHRDGVTRPRVLGHSRGSY